MSFQNKAESSSGAASVLVREYPTEVKEGVFRASSQIMYGTLEVFDEEGNRITDFLYKFDGVNSLIEVQNKNKIRITYVKAG